MEKPPMEWIDKLFACMEEFYGSRWRSEFISTRPEAMMKTLWQSMLTGCSHEEIRSVLVFLKRAAQDPAVKPPNYLEFFRFAKGFARPHINYDRDFKRRDTEIARRAMAEINTKLGRRSTLVDNNQG